MIYSRVHREGLRNTFCAFWVPDGPPSTGGFHPRFRCTLLVDVTGMLCGTLPREEFFAEAVMGGEVQLDDTPLLALTSYRRWNDVIYVLSTTFGGGSVDLILLCVCMHAVLLLLHLVFCVRSVCVQLN